MQRTDSFSKHSLRETTVTVDTLTVPSHADKAPGASPSLTRPVRVCLWALCAVLASLTPHAEAGTLKACVLGRDGNPKAHVAVEILASGRIQVEQTGNNGCFSTNLNNGKYVIRIRENRRRQDFNVEIPSGGVDKSFKVKW